MASNRFEKHPIVSISFLILFVFIIFDLGLGLILIPRSFNDFRTLDPVYHHGLLPNQSTLAAWGPLVYPMNTNSLGFRDSAVYQVSVKMQGKRILVLGDSHTEAVGIDFKSSFFGKLQTSARTKGIEMLNGSAVSYSPKIYYLKSKYLIEKLGFQTDEIWIFIDISDLQNELAYEKFIPSEAGILTKTSEAILHFLKRYSFTSYSIVKLTDQSRYNKFAEAMNAFDSKRGQSGTNNTVELYETFFRDFHDKELLRNPEFHGVGSWYYDSAFIKLADKGLDLGMENISKLNELCKSRNIKIKLSVHPWQTQVMKQDTSDYYVNRWKNYCKKEGIEFINLFPVFINGENPEMAVKKYYIPNDNHWSELGHDRVATFLEKYIQK